MLKKLSLILGSVSIGVACIIGLLIIRPDKPVERSSETTNISTAKSESKKADISITNKSDAELNSDDSKNDTSSEKPVAGQFEVEITSNSETRKTETNGKETSKPETTKSSEDNTAKVVEESVETTDLNNEVSIETREPEEDKAAEEEARKYEEERQREEEARKRAAEASAMMGYSVASAGDPSKGEYPYSEECPKMQDSYPDPWGMYICECVSYTSWKVYQTYGYMPYWGGHGNANQWPTNARSMGISVSNTPKAGTVGIMMSGYYGHSVWVERVSEDGSRVYVSQYNVINAMTDHWGDYSEQWYNSDSFVYIDFGQRM